MRGVIRDGDKVRVTGFAKSAIETFVGEQVAPTTAEELKAWYQEAVDCADHSVPEERLMAAIFAQAASEL